MRDLFVKLWILKALLSSGIKGSWREWLSEIWEKELDAPYCCGGGSGSWDICGCEGATVREIYWRKS